MLQSIKELANHEIGKFQNSKYDKWTQQYW